MRIVNNIDVESSPSRRFANDLKKDRRMLFKCPECGGSLIVEKTKMTSRILDLGESIGYKTCWCRVQRRHCETCKLTEERTKWRSGRDWSDWEPCT